MNYDKAQVMGWPAIEVIREVTIASYWIWTGDIGYIINETDGIVTNLHGVGATTMTVNGQPTDYTRRYTLDSFQKLLSVWK